MIEKRADGVSVEAMCEVLEVSASGYYASRNRPSCKRHQADMQLGEDVERVFVESRLTYGSDRVHQKLRQQGIRTSRKRVARLMQERGFRSGSGTQTAYWIDPTRGSHLYP